MNSYVLGFQEIDKTKLMVVGGKGANLGELSRIEGIRVPEGFCIFEQGLKDARQKEQDILSRLTMQPGGKRKAKKAKKV